MDIIIFIFKAAREEKEEKRSRFREDRERQEELCAQLRSALADLRRQREKRYVSLDLLSRVVGFAAAIKKSTQPRCRRVSY